MNYHILTFVLLATAVSCRGQRSRQQIEEGIAKARKVPQLDVCGHSNSVFGTKVINGKEAELDAYPWMAAIGYKGPYSNNIYWGCGGSLITNQHVITAAHCGYAPTLGAYKLNSVRLGELNLDDNEVDGASPIDFEIDKFIPHEEYNNYKKINDIAIIKIKGTVQFTDHIKPICLPPPEFRTNMFVTFSPIVAGWGISINNSQAKTDTRLLEAELTIQDLDECKTNLTSVLPGIVIDHKVICAYSPRQDSCGGDSGGPLMFPRKVRGSPSDSPGNVFLMGIVSYGYFCARPGFPGVYTRVTEHMAWIMDNLDI